MSTTNSQTETNTVLGAVHYLTLNERERFKNLQTKLPNCSYSDILGLIEIEREELITGRSNKWYCYLSAMYMRNWKRRR
jgi:hypothetical protein